jgi:hypothetical protein
VFVNVTELINEGKIEELKKLGFEKLDIEIDKSDLDALHDEDGENFDDVEWEKQQF